MPDRERKPLVEAVSKAEPEEPLRKPARKNLKSANRIVLIDKKAMHKE